MGAVGQVVLDVTHHLLAGLEDDDALLAVLGEGDVVQLAVAVEEPAQVLDVVAGGMTAEGAAAHLAEGIYLRHVQAAQGLALLVIEDHRKVQRAVGEGVLILGAETIVDDPQVNRNREGDDGDDDRRHIEAIGQGLQERKANHGAEDHHDPAEIVEHLIQAALVLGYDFFQKTIHGCNPPENDYLSR